MIRSFRFLTFLMLGAFSGSAPSLLQAQDTKWVSLFDGKTMDGWEKVGKEESKWEVTDGALAGYLVGCPVDPARDPRFAEIGYFQTFASQCAAFPAHLHINLVPAARSQGLGGRLISAFAGDVARAGLPGLHIVTGQSARNVGFYQQQGFVLIAQAPWRTSTVVFMGRPV